MVNLRRSAVFEKSSYKPTVRLRGRRECKTKNYFGDTEYKVTKWTELAQKRFQWRNELSGAIKTGNICVISVIIYFAKKMTPKPLGRFEIHSAVLLQI
jgi:hypothetical protein